MRKTIKEKDMLYLILRISTYIGKFQDSYYIWQYAKVIYTIYLTNVKYQDFIITSIILKRLTAFSACG